MGHDPLKIKPETTQQPKCIGLFGRLLGHKFNNSYGTAKLYNNSACWRCGYVPGKET